MHPHRVVDSVSTLLRCIYVNYQWREQDEFIERKGGLTFKTFPENAELIQLKIHRELCAEVLAQWTYRAYPLLYTQRRAIEQQIASCISDASNDLKRLEGCALDTYQRKRFWIERIRRCHRRRQNRGRNRNIRRSSRNHFRGIYRWNSRRLFCRENRNFLNKYRN